MLHDIDMFNVFTFCAISVIRASGAFSRRVDTQIEACKSTKQELLVVHWHFS